MAYGIVKLINYSFLKSIYLIITRKRNLLKFKKNCLKLGWNVTLRNCKFGRNVYIDDDTLLVDSSVNNFSYISKNCKIRDTKIGKFCSIASGVKIVLGIHPTDFVSTHPAFYANNKSFNCFADKVYINEFESVTIGNDVWIGEDVLIPGGIKIGNGAIIAACAVVTKDVEPYAIVGGIPAKHIRYRFDENTIRKIQESNWWDEEDSFFKANFMAFHSPSEFLSLIRRKKK